VVVVAAFASVVMLTFLLPLLVCPGRRNPQREREKSKEEKSCV